jgi:hypothetical protein
MIFLGFIGIVLLSLFLQLEYTTILYPLPPIEVNQYTLPLEYCTPAFFCHDEAVYRAKEYDYNLFKAWSRDCILKTKPHDYLAMRFYLLKQTICATG